VACFALATLSGGFARVRSQRAKYGVLGEIASGNDFCSSCTSSACWPSSILICCCAFDRNYSTSRTQCFLVRLLFSFQLLESAWRLGRIRIRFPVSSVCLRLARRASSHAIGRVDLSRDAPVHCGHRGGGWRDGLSDPGPPDLDVAGSIQPPRPSVRGPLRSPGVSS